MDGSFHPWPEKRGAVGGLPDMVDDATGAAGGHFAEEETTWAAADSLRAWVEQHGTPQDLFTDWRNVYRRPAMLKEDLAGAASLTQFGRMEKKLG